MRIAGVDVLKFAVSVAGVCFLSGFIGCATYRPAQVGRQTSEETFSLKGTGHELGRGVTNIALCWLEVPHEIEARVRESDSGRPFGIVSNAFGAALGALNGAIWGVERAVGGAFEVVLSPFPPYDPIMKPAYPPYLNFQKKAPEEKPAQASEKKE
jgi:putative exosortase-associated protein (TIGR04073 family)